MVIVSSLFMNSILGLFGLASTSIETLQELRASQQVVAKMKQHHKNKKLKASKTFTKRTTKRVASTALAAATIGTVAVAAVTTTLEVDDYCEDKKSLQEDANILYGTDTTFDLAQCIEEGKQDSKTIMAQVKNSSIEAVSSAFQVTTDYSYEKWALVKQASIRAIQSTGDTAEGLWDTVRSWVEN